MNTQTLGAMIASLRRESGMTQLELAEIMGVTDKAVSKWERELSCPDVASLPKLAETLGVSVDELMRTKTGGKRAERSEGDSKIVSLLLTAIPLAMGVSVAVLSVLKEIDLYSGFFMLGIGLFCGALSRLQRSRE